MRGRAPEFSRPVSLMRLGAAPLRQRLVATGPERAALAARFDLVSLDRLEAAVELRREPEGTILLSASFAAAFAQTCTVTLDPVPGEVEATFQLRYGPPEAEAAAPGGDDDPAYEPLDGETIDLGEAVAQEFSLVLPPFPRAPDAVVESGPAEEPAPSPFAALARLAGPKPD